MEIAFTNFYPLERLTPIILDGFLDKGWNRQYSSVKVGGKNYIYPDNLGCGQNLVPPRLLNENLLPPEVQRVSLDARGLIYVLTSTVYPILYVGISAKNLGEGLFNSGRISHHLRKLFAVHNSSTSHTQGWQSHAINRYADRVSISAKAAAEGPFAVGMSSVGSDLQIAFGYTSEDVWNCEDFEGTVFDYFEKRLKAFHPNLVAMNTGKMQRHTANIIEPKNTIEMIQSFSSSDLTKIEHSLDLKAACDWYGSMKGQNSNIYAIAASLSKVFKTLWDDGWRDTLNDMAEQWQVIDDCAEMILDIALQSSVKPQFFREYIEILKVYKKSTDIHMKDIDGQGKWKLEKVNQLIATANRALEG